MELPSVLSRDTKELKIKDIKNFLRGIKSSHSYKTKEEYIKKLNIFKNIFNFTWREDQQNIITSFLKNEHDLYCIHGLFGSGKTTLLIGMVIQSIVYKLYSPEDVMFISFNVSIRNELKKKLKSYGISSKVSVRTFDSIIYELAKFYNYKYIDLPNYDGKRKFVYEQIYENATKPDNFTGVKLLIIDELQDLEKYCLDIILTFFPNTKIICCGDIFQSIQKESKESILWYIMNNQNYTGLLECKKIQKSYMKITPRVPKNILYSLQNTLTDHYPEMKSIIQSWESTNPYDGEVNWNYFSSYTDIYNELDLHCSTYDHKDLMILTFSSSITVKGAVGDIGRLRNYLSSRGIDVNTNHKRMDDNKLFLTTSNSSKGLERDVVVCFLTFPLEKAFIHYSIDLVLNLITVALTRAKKKVYFYVPQYKDKYSEILYKFKDCVKPESKVIRQDTKTIKEYTFSDFMNNEIDITTLIRMGIISYDTRIKLRETLKCFKTDNIFDPCEIPSVSTEEEKSFLGILFENLLTSLWTNRYPLIADIENTLSNPMYNNCSSKIRSLTNEYNRNITNNTITFDNIYLYSQIHCLLSNKLHINFSYSFINQLKYFWNSIKHKCLSIKPQVESMLVQHKVRMGNLSGVIDIFGNKKTIYEIKCCKSYDYIDNATIQAVLYSLSQGLNSSEIVIINLFRNEIRHYNFQSKDIITLREIVKKEIIAYNFNSFLSKSKYDNKLLNDNQVYLNINKTENGELLNYSLIECKSPIRINVLQSVYTNVEFETRPKENIEKKYYESKLFSHDIKKMLDNDLILCNKLGKNIIMIDNNTEYNDILTKLSYVKSKHNNVDINCNIIQTLLYISKLL